MGYRRVAVSVTAGGIVQHTERDEGSSSIYVRESDVNESAIKRFKSFANAMGDVQATRDVRGLWSNT